MSGAVSGFEIADNVSATFSRTAGENVGMYTISAALGPSSVLGNYDITYATAGFVIALRPASVTPNPAGKTFGDPDPSPLTTGTLSGFLGGDGVTVAYIRTSGETPGQYTMSAVLSASGSLSN